MIKAINLNNGKIALIEYFSKRVNQDEEPDDEGKVTFTWIVKNVMIVADPTYQKDWTPLNVLSRHEFLEINQAVKDIDNHPKFKDFQD